ncbi:unnamed protein product, partial [Polarella glacialis]
ASQLHGEGNHFFGDGQWRAAAARYRSALALCDSEAFPDPENLAQRCRGNLAACALREGDFDEALRQSESVSSPASVPDSATMIAWLDTALSHVRHLHLCIAQPFVDVERADCRLAGELSCCPMSWPSLPRSFKRIREVINSPCVNISLGQLLRSTSSDPLSLQQSAQWLQNQLPIRFARRIEDILQLPHVVVINPQINSILSTYIETFERVSAFPEVRTPDDEADFLELIKDQLAKHNSGTRLVAEGYRDVRALYPSIRLEAFLHDHFTTRIATRILMDNYVEMRSPQPGFYGVVCQGMRPLDIIQQLSAELIELTRSLYGSAPEVEFRGNPDCILDYIPRHVKYMLRELLKNAFRSTVERHLRKGGGSLTKDIPPVVVELQQGDVHVIIKISDQGGGMPKHVQKEAWQYGWTTVESSHGEEASMVAEESCTWDRARSTAVVHSKSSELAGYGFGLPLTRLHAQYFGGDVFMQAMPGHGTDMYLMLTHLKEGTPSTEIDDLSTNLYAKALLVEPTHPKNRFRHALALIRRRSAPAAGPEECAPETQATASSSSGQRRHRARDLLQAQEDLEMAGARSATKAVLDALEELREEAAAGSVHLRPQPWRFPAGLRDFEYRHGPDQEAQAQPVPGAAIDEGCAPGLERNLMIMLHGFGGRKEPFLGLAENLQLPKTATLCFNGPEALPDELLDDPPGFSWFAMLDEETMDFIRPSAKERRRLLSLEASAKLLAEAIEVLVDHCGWLHNEIFLLGYGQGGTLALDFLLRPPSPRLGRLGGVVGVATEVLPERLAKGPRPLVVEGDEVPSVLLIHGALDKQTSPAAAKASLQRLQEDLGALEEEVKLKVFPDRGGEMLRGGHEEESRCLMEFLSDRLHGVGRRGSQEAMEKLGAEQVSFVEKLPEDAMPFAVDYAMAALQPSLSEMD